MPSLDKKAPTSAASTEANDVASLSYSDFQSHVANGRIESVIIDDGTLRGQFVSPVEGRNRFVMGALTGQSPTV